jgi:hypothetical protein
MAMRRSLKIRESVDVPIPKEQSMVYSALGNSWLRPRCWALMDLDDLICTTDPV